MRKQSVKRLPLRTPLPHAVYHESGKRLHDFEEVLSSKHLHLLEDAGIEHVFIADRLERHERIEADLRIKKANNLGLARNEQVARPVYADDGTLIVDSGQKVTNEVIEFLMKNNIESVWVDKRDSELHLDQVSKYRKNVQKYIVEKKPIPGFGEQSVMDNLLQLVKDLNVVNALEELGPEALRAEVTGPPLNRMLPKLNPERLRTPQELNNQLEVHKRCCSRIEALYTKLAQEEEVKISEIDQVIADMLKAALRDRALLLAIMHQPRDGEYLYNHTVNVFTLAVNLAILMGYDEALLKEVSYAAFFNACGMLLIPDEIRNKAGRLTDGEAQEIRNHTTYSVRLISRVKGIPKMLPLIVFQSHEHMDGRGYPRGKKADEIHDLAKVIAVADVYSAMISNRPYRKGEQPYKALEEVIRLAGQRKYDANVVRALLKAVNLFPVGTWVKLADRSMGVVVCPSEEEYARPHVRVVYRQGKRVPGFPLIPQEGEGAVNIETAIAPPGGSSALAAFCRFD